MSLATPFQRLKDYHRASRTALSGAVATLPVAIIYGAGALIAAPEARQGLDWISSLFEVAIRPRLYLIAVGIIGALIVAWALRVDGRRAPRRLTLALGIIGESTVYALVVGTVILALMEEHHLMGPILLPAVWIDRVVVACGAGLHEELIFRALLIPVLIALCTRALRMAPGLGLAIAIIGSSALFAAAHHWAGEPWTEFVFIYRVFIGMAFALLYLGRGLGVAVWTHALYDLYVLSLAALDAAAPAAAG